MWLAAAAVPLIVSLGYGVLAAHMWLRSRLVLGPTSAETRRLLQELVDLSRQGDGLRWTRLVLLYASIGLLLVALASGEWKWLLPAVAPLIMLWWIRVRTTTPPLVLLLGTSTHTSVRRHRDVKRAVSPLRVVSLLDSEIPWDRELAREVALDCYRTTDDDEWWRVLTRLMEIVPIIAIDAAARTPGVLREMDYIRESNLARKCLFLTPPDGSASIVGDGGDLRFALYEDAARAIVALTTDGAAAAAAGG